MRSFFLILYCLSSSMVAYGQPLSGPKLLERCIAYHDPSAEWPDARISLELEQNLEDGKYSRQTVNIDLPASTFSILWENETESRYREIRDTACAHRLNQQSDFDDEARKKYKLDCGTTARYRDYYVYLYGLPMKLRDPGTLVQDSVYKRNFMDQECWVVTIHYEPAVGEHIWEIYVHPETYAMIGYAFYRNPQTRKGEYISMEGELTVGNMRIPKDRTWYTYPDHKVLGTDKLVKISKLNPE